MQLNLKWAVQGIIILSAISFFILLFFASPNGLGMSPDSVAYIRAAKDFLSNKGLTSFTSQWPPLYPSLIVLICKMFGFSPLNGARFLQAIIISANFIAVYYVIRNYAFIGRFLALFFAVLLCLQGVITYTHFYAWTEPLFIFFILVNLIILSKTNDFNFKINNKKNIYFILMMVATLALYTRYIGLVVAMLNAIIICLRWEGSIFKRITLSIPQVLIPLILITPWLMHRSEIQNANTDRKLIFNGVPVDGLEAGLGNIGRWIFPSKLSAEHFGGNIIQTGIGLLVVTVIFIYVYKFFISTFFKKNKIPKNLLIDNRFNAMPIALFILLYLLSILFFIIFVDKKIMLDNRILSPIYLPLMIWIICCCGNINNWTLKVIGLTAITVSLISFYPELRARLLISYFNGIELASKHIMNKPIIQFVSKCSKDLRVGSDFPWNYDLFFNKKVYWLPQHNLFGSGLSNTNYKNEISQLPSQVDMIVVDNKLSDIVREIDALPVFSKIYDGDGYIWINSDSPPIICK